MKTIAISGKGGTGKTTITTLIIRWLSKHGARPVLAVDADSNVNLNDTLGVELKETIGTVREEMKILSGKLPGGMTKQQFLEYKIQAGLVETPDYDLIAMGRPEGPGCYCYANNVLRDILSALSSNYQYVVIDNQAGMEHLSRRTAQNIDYLLLISDSSARGIRSAGNISRLLRELDTRIGKKYLILNRIQNSIPQHTTKTIEDEGLDLLGSIPEEKTVLELDQNGQPVWEISSGSPVYQAVDQFMKELLS